MIPLQVQESGGLRNGAVYDSHAIHVHIFWPELREQAGDGRCQLRHFHHAGGSCCDSADLRDKQIVSDIRPTSAHRHDTLTRGPILHRIGYFLERNTRQDKARGGEIEEMQLHEH